MGQAGGEYKEFAVRCHWHPVNRKLPFKNSINRYNMTFLNKVVDEIEILAQRFQHKCALSRVLWISSQRTCMYWIKKIGYSKISYMRNDFISCFDDFALNSSSSNAFITTKKTISLCVILNFLLRRYGREDLINYLIVGPARHNPVSLLQNDPSSKVHLKKAP